MSLLHDLRIPGLAPILARLTAATLALTGCSSEDEGPGQLFDEQGVWELRQFSLEGNVLEPVSNTRAEAFLMRFEGNVVQTAMCAEDIDDTPGNSTCRLSGQDAEWFCECFAVRFEGDRMVWKSFEAGEDVPEATFDFIDTNSTVLQVNNVENVAFTHGFQPMPGGVFGSDGSNSRYVFEQRPLDVFAQVFDDPDGRQTCAPCTDDF